MTDQPLLRPDLRTAFADMKDFSRANLMYMRAFAETWRDAAIVQQAVGRSPSGGNLAGKPKQPAQIGSVGALRPKSPHKSPSALAAPTWMPKSQPSKPAAPRPTTSKQSMMQELLTGRVRLV